MTYRFYKNLNRRTAADKALYDKAFNIAKNHIISIAQLKSNLLMWNQTHKLTPVKKLII